MKEKIKKYFSERERGKYIHLILEASYAIKYQIYKNKNKSSEVQLREIIEQTKFMKKEVLVLLEKYDIDNEDRIKAIKETEINTFLNCSIVVQAISKSLNTIQHKYIKFPFRFFIKGIAGIEWLVIFGLGFIMLYVMRIV